MFRCQREGQVQESQLGLRIRTDEGLSKEAVPTEYTLRVTQCPPCGMVIPLGAALPAARRCLRVCLVPAEPRVSAWCQPRVSAWCQLGTDARDCLYLALNGRVLRARYISFLFLSLSFLSISCLGMAGGVSNFQGIAHTGECEGSSSVRVTPPK